MYYFAYGSNMNHGQMKTRCPGSKFLKRAYIEGYKFVYDGYSSFRQGAVANIIKDEGCIVWGALFEIDEKCLEKLDIYEGYPTCYQREVFSVKDDEGKEYKALVYLRNPKPVGKPSSDYKNITIEGAKQCGLPDDYIKQFIAQEE
ncbi:MAG: gamma-glutamylcyclotransferase family protein [candidate division WOR-3 bacterium]